MLCAVVSMFAGVLCHHITGWHAWSVIVCPYIFLYTSDHDDDDDDDDDQFKRFMEYG